MENIALCNEKYEAPECKCVEVLCEGVLLSGSNNVCIDHDINGWEQVSDTNIELDW